MLNVTQNHSPMIQVTAIRLAHDAYTLFPEWNVALRKVQRVRVHDVHSSRHMLCAEHGKASLLHRLCGGVMDAGQVTRVEEQLRSQVEELVSTDGSLERDGA